MLHYDEARRVRLLEELAAPARTVFALLCASRLLPAYRRFHEATGRGDPDVMEAIARDLWRHLDDEALSQGELRTAIGRCTALIPTEDDGWEEDTQPYAEDAAAALAYASCAALSGDPRDAAWAGRCAYEAVDHLAGRLRPLGDDCAIRHPLVQAELGRQERDLAELAALGRGMEAQLSALRSRAEREAESVFVLEVQ